MVNTPGLSNIDLNLINSLYLLFETRSVTKAAERAGISQPAMSRTLQRMRQHFDDPLFVNSKQGLTPTAYAVQLVEKLQPSIEQIRDVLSAESMNLQKAKGSFHLCLPNAMQPGTVSSVVQTVLNAYPDVEIEVSSWSEQSEELLVKGQIGLVFGFIPEPPNGIKFHSMAKDTFAVIHRNGHPVGNTLTLDQYLEYPHVLFNPNSSGRSIVNRFLYGMGKQRKVAVKVDDLQTAFEIVSKTDLLLTAPKFAAENQHQTLDLTVKELPFEGPRFSYAFYWPAVLHRDPLFTAIRTLIIGQFEKFHFSARNILY